MLRSIDKRGMAILSIVFGVLILLRPEFLTYIVAAYFIVVGTLSLIER